MPAQHSLGVVKLQSPKAVKNEDYKVPAKKFIDEAALFHAASLNSSSSAANQFNLLRSSMNNSNMQQPGESVFGTPYPVASESMQRLLPRNQLSNMYTHNSRKPKKSLGRSGSKV